jgi:hypothetical protein
MGSVELDDPLLAELGRITVLFGRLEGSLRIQLARLVDPDDPSIGAIFSNGLEFWRLTETLKSLVLYIASKRLRFVATIKSRLGELTSALDKARDARNNVVHSLWLVRIEINVGAGDSVPRFVTDVGLTLRSKRGQISANEKDYSLADLKEVVAQIVNAQRTLDDFMSWLDGTA